MERLSHIFTILHTHLQRSFVLYIIWSARKLIVCLLWVRNATYIYSNIQTNEYTLLIANGVIVSRRLVFIML